MKMTVFWDVAPCSVIEVYRRFGGAYCFHYQGDEWLLFRSGATIAQRWLGAELSYMNRCTDSRPVRVGFMANKVILIQTFLSVFCSVILILRCSIHISNPHLLCSPWLSSSQFYHHLGPYRRFIFDTGRQSGHPLNAFSLW
jgi:hypothetical protein